MCHMLVQRWGAGPGGGGDMLSPSSVGLNIELYLKLQLPDVQKHVRARAEAFYRLSSPSHTQ